MTPQYYMQLALQLAQQAAEEGEIPVGAVIVSPQQQLLAKAYNQTERLQDPTAHAEILAITAACQALGAKYLKQCSLYVTLEPCVMCAGAIFWAQIGTLVWGASDEKRGFSMFEPTLVHPKTQLMHGVLAEECKGLLQDFFRKLR
ncbi:MAG TPA: tRNA-specific adenosine deaminase [Microscillaceae bacterium]|jgi:tRNA(adenine34) deaminase|nr:tRNA-specific adenosine deaminase [Microscillaceae bacterium]